MIFHKLHMSLKRAYEKNGNCEKNFFSNIVTYRLLKKMAEWNYHKIKYSKGCQVSGIPNQLNHLPESKSYISQGFRVTESDVTNALSTTEL